MQEQFQFSEKYVYFSFAHSNVGLQPYIKENELQCICDRAGTITRQYHNKQIQHSIATSNFSNGFLDITLLRSLLSVFITLL